MVKKIWMGKESLNQPSNLGFGAWGKESLYKRTPFATHTYQVMDQHHIDCN